MSINTKMTAIANAIRAKTSSSALLSLDDMPAAIASIQTGTGSATSGMNLSVSVGTVLNVTTVTGPTVSVSSNMFSISSPEIVTEE